MQYVYLPKKLYNFFATCIRELKKEQKKEFFECSIEIWQISFWIIALYESFKASPNNTILEK